MDGPVDGRMDGPIDGQTRPTKEMGGSIKNNLNKQILYLFSDNPSTIAHGRPWKTKAYCMNQHENVRLQSLGHCIYVWGQCYAYPSVG